MSAEFWNVNWGGNQRMLKSKVATRPTVMRERVRSGMPAQEADRRSEITPMVVLPFRDDSSVYEQNVGGSCAVEAWRLELVDRGAGGAAGSALERTA